MCVCVCVCMHVHVWLVELRTTYCGNSYQQSSTMFSSYSQGHDKLISCSMDPTDPTSVQQLADDDCHHHRSMTTLCTTRHDHNPTLTDVAKQHKFATNHGNFLFQFCIYNCTLSCMILQEMMSHNPSCLSTSFKLSIEK